MRKGNSKLKIIVPLLGALAAGRAGAQAIDNSFFNRTGDFMLVSQYMHELPRETKTSIESLLRGGNVTSIYAIDPIVGLNSRIKFLNSKRAKEFYSEEERQLLIGRYQKFMSEIFKEKRSSDYGKSLAKLTTAVKDGMINPKELNGIEDNVYMIVKEGRESGCNNPYSVFALVRLREENQKPCELETKKEYGKIIQPALPKVPEEKPIIDESCNLNKPLDKTPQESKLDIQKNSEENKIKDIPKVPEEKKQLVEEKKKEIYASFIAEGKANSAFDSFGGSAGIRVGNESIGLGALLDLGFGLDKLIDSYEGPLSAERTAYGTVTDTNKLSIGGSLELKIGPCIFGAGADYSNGLRTTIEQIRDKYGSVIKSNTNSTPNRQVFAKGYAGFELGPEDWKVRIIAGYHERDRLYFGAGTSIKLNQSKKEKK